MTRLVHAAALSAALLAGTAQAIPMSALFDNGFIEVGDKRFDQWSLVSFDASDGREFNAADIDVAGIDDGGDYGLDFNVLNNALAVIGDGGFAFVDLSFAFRVSVLDPTLGVSGARLDFVSGGGTVNDDGDNDVGVFILESLGSAALLDDLGSLQSELSMLDDILTSELSDATTFAPRSEVFVTKNILVHAVDDTDSVWLTSFSQRFPQTPIPEPGSLALTMLALAVGGRRWNSRANG